MMESLEVMGENKGILGVHAENDAISIFREKMNKKLDKLEAADFAAAKSNLVEAEAVNRANYLNKASSGNLYIFHLSTKESLEILAAEKGKANSITAETCTHYLCLDESYYQREDGHRFLCSPPLRSKADQEALWEGIKNGVITTVSTDHCGFDKELKDSGDGKYNETPNGLPGIGMLLPLMYTYGVKKDRISINKMVEIISTNTAKTFGMYPQKGDIQIGADADIVIFDPDKEIKMDAEIIPSDVDWSPYEGMDLAGFPLYTISRGEVILENGKITAERGRGNYLSRELAPTGYGTNFYQK